MSFNPDPSKQAEEVTFNGLLTKYIIYPFLFVNSVVQQISTQNYLGIHLDEELTFKHHINEKINQTIRTLKLFVNSMTFFLVSLY